MLSALLRSSAAVASARGLAAGAVSCLGVGASLPSLARSLVASVAAMGGDCCGGDAPGGMAALALEDAHARTAEAPAAEASGGAGAGGEPPSHAAYVESKAPFYQKRIDLFEKYRRRELERIEAARAAGEPIEVVCPRATSPMRACVRQLGLLPTHCVM